MRTILMPLGIVFTFILSMAGCSGSKSPTEPGKDLDKLPSPQLIGAWSLKINPVSRQSQSLTYGEGINIELNEVDKDGQPTEIGSHMTMDVFTEVYMIGEAQILTLKCAISFDQTTIGQWYEPRLYVDFNAANDDAIPVDGNKDKYVLVNADGLSNIRNMPNTDPEDFDPFVRYIDGSGDAIFNSQATQPFNMTLQVQMPNVFQNDSNENVVRWNLYLYASSLSAWTVGSPPYPTLVFPPDPYAMHAEFDQNATSNVIEVNDNVIIDASFNTHLGTFSGRWDESNFVAEANYDQLSGLSNGFVSLHFVTTQSLSDNVIDFYSNSITINVSPGTYYVPIRCRLDYSGDLSTEEGFNNPVFEGVFKVVVEPDADDPNAPVPGGFRIFYLKDLSTGSGTEHMLFAQDSLTQREVQLTDPSWSTGSYTIANIVNYDISEDGKKWVYEAEGSGGVTMSFLSSDSSGSPGSPYTSYPMDDGSSSGDIIQNPKISSDGAVAVWQDSSPNGSDPWNPRSRIFIKRLQSGGHYHAVTDYADNDYSNINPRISNPCVEKVDSIGGYDRYLVLYATDASTPGDNAHIASGLQFTICTDNGVDLATQHVSTIYHPGPESSKPTMAEDLSSIVWIVGGGNEDIL